jgi:serine/threonine protein phosphatase PrpC
MTGSAEITDHAVLPLRVFMAAGSSCSGLLPRGPDSHRSRFGPADECRLAAGLDACFRAGPEAALDSTQRRTGREVRMTALTTYAAGSDTGLVRAGNEDSAYAGRWLQAVADGMGGHVAGEVASAVVIQSLRSHDVPASPADLVDILGHAAEEANAAIRRRVEADPALRTMGTTLTAMLWSGSSVAIVHIGDSRAYLLRDGRLHQITEDHTLGKLISGAKASAVLAPVMSRFLDGRPDRSPDLGLRDAELGDRYLLCSDGLSGVLAPAALREVLASASDPGEAVRQLIQLANDAGGEDNITAIVVDVLDERDHPGPLRAVTLGAAAAGTQAVP